MVGADLWFPLIIVTRLALNPQSPQLNISHISFSRLFIDQNILVDCCQGVLGSLGSDCLKVHSGVAGFGFPFDGSVTPCVVSSYWLFFTHRSLSPLHQQSKDFNLAISSAPMALMSVMAVLRSSSMALYRSFWLSNSKYTSFRPTGWNCKVSVRRHL